MRPNAPHGISQGPHDSGPKPPGASLGNRRSLWLLCALFCAALAAYLGQGLALAAEPPTYISSFGPDGTETTSFHRTGAIAVDQGTHEVYVLDSVPNSGAYDVSLYKFDGDGTPVPFGASEPYVDGNSITGLTTPSALPQVALNSTSHVLYVTSGTTVMAFNSDGGESTFTAGPGAGTNEISGFSSLGGVAVDENGAIYVSDFGPNGASTISIYAPSGALLTEFNMEYALQLAVDSNGAVYVVRSNQPIQKFFPSEFPVTPATTYSAAPEPFTPNLSTGVAVDPATNDVYVAGEFSTNPRLYRYAETGELLTTFGGPGEPGEVLYTGGIAFDSLSERVFASRSTVNEYEETVNFIGIYGPEVVPVGPPSIEGLSISEVAADSATFRARVNPDSAETTYRFEYGPGDCAVTVCESVPADGFAIGAGHHPVAVSQIAGGLSPDTTYYYRVVAENSFGATTSPSRTFTTHPLGLGFKLPDRRVWELVSPANKSGGLVRGSTQGLVQAASDGNSVSYPSFGPIEDDPEGNRVIEVSSVLSRRDGSGWLSRNITPPHDRVVPLALGDPAEYRLFSTDLRKAVFQQRDDALLSPEASGRTPYLRQNNDPPSYTPLVTSKEGFANVGSDVDFGGDLASGHPPVAVEGANPDLTHIVLSSTVPLIDGAPSGALYLWNGGELSAVSELPADEGAAITQAGGIGSQSGSLRHAISDDGSRVFWETGQYSITNNLTALYMRDIGAEETVRLDVAQPGASGAGEPKPVFQAASTDGRIVYFTDPQQLTPNASSSGADLYRCEIPLDDPSGGCNTLTNVGAPLAGSAESAEVLGLAPAISDDGSHVFFVAKGVLDSAANAAGDSPVANRRNLYLWTQDGGTRFIGTLANRDSFDWGGGTVGEAGKLSAQGSPNGRYLAFMSQRSLVGNDNRDVTSGEAVEEVFLYDAQTDLTVCVSCNPFGVSPEGEVLSLGDQISRPIDPRGLWSLAETRVGATLPEATSRGEVGLGGPSFYHPRAVLDSGRVYFNSIEPLVPADSNGQWDVYQYEPAQAGNCDELASEAATARSPGGCASLISSGVADAEAAFLDASASGDDVFFLTPARLSAVDVDAELDVYDARVDGVSAAIPSVSECQGEACQPLIAPPNDPTPGSASFRGAGNQRHPAEHRRCPRGKHRIHRKGKARCVPRKGGHRSQPGHSKRGATR